MREHLPFLTTTLQTVGAFLNAQGHSGFDGGPNLNGRWYIYTISAVQDYQKLSVWSDGYYIAENTSGFPAKSGHWNVPVITGNPNTK
ncbi:MAG: hypothetical protein R2793_03695 [Flavobacteriaceae bacterium]